MIRTEITQVLEFQKLKMGIRCSKSKKRQEIQTFNAWESNKKVEELTRQLQDHQKNLEEKDQIIKVNTQCIIDRDRDITNLEEAIKERDIILKGVKWALSLETKEPWSPKPVLASRRPKLQHPPNNARDPSAPNRDDLSKGSSEDIQEISNDKTFC